MSQELLQFGCYPTNQVDSSKNHLAGLELLTFYMASCLFSFASCLIHFIFPEPYFHFIWLPYLEPLVCWTSQSSLSYRRSWSPLALEYFSRASIHSWF